MIDSLPTVQRYRRVKRIVRCSDIGEMKRAGAPASPPSAAAHLAVDGARAVALRWRELRDQVAVELGHRVITIERVAVEFADMTLSLPKPHRHHELIRWHTQITGKYGSGRQGFVTSAGGFVDRRQAASIAFDARQIQLPKRMLFSEDLW